MSESVLVQEGAASNPVGLSQVERVVDAYVAPSKTFEDIKRSAAWWFPFLLTALLAVIFSYVVLNKIGLPTLVDGVVQQTPSLEEKLASSTPEQAAGIRRSVEIQFKFMYVAPVFFLIVGAIVAAIFLATANFAFGGRATYKQMLAVWFYGTLPLALASILTMVTVYAGVAGDSFNIKNTIGTNIGYYLMNGDSPKWLVTLLSSVDVLAIWAALLLTIGISMVAGIKRSAAAVVVFGWWGLYVLCQSALAAFTS